MLRPIAVVLFLGSALACNAQGSPSSQQQQMEQPPGAPQPMQSPTGDPNALAMAPPAFAPGVGAGNDAAATQPRLVRVSGGVMAGNLVSKVDPVYPDSARAARMQGVVVLSVRIGANGRVESLSVTSGPQPLQRAAMDAVKQWIYRPYVLNGYPVEVSTMVAVNFKTKR